MCQMANAAKAIMAEVSQTDRQAKVLRVNSFPGSTEGIWAVCKTVAQRKGELSLFFKDHMLLFRTGARLNGI